MVLLIVLATSALLAASAFALIVAGSKGAGMADFIDRPCAGCWDTPAPAPSCASPARSRPRAASSCRPRSGTASAAAIWSRWPVPTARSRHDRNVRVDNLRRSIRNDRMKQVYDQAIAAGWIARLRGSGHIRMTAPNDKRTFLTISVTASGARSALNVEAVLKRWQREQEVQTVSNERIEAAIERAELDQSLNEVGLKHGTVPQIPEREPRGQARGHPPAGAGAPRGPGGSAIRADCAHQAWSAPTATSSSDRAG